MYWDEHVDGAIVRWLRAAGHDVVAAAESHAGASDSTLLEIAYREQRFILTKDKDFGEQVFHQRKAALGVVLLRLSSRPTREHASIVQHAWPILEPRLPGHFIIESFTRLTTLAAWSRSVPSLIVEKHIAGDERR